MKSTTLLPGIIAALLTSSTTNASPMSARQSGGGGDDVPQTGPFFLQVQSNDSTVNGRYLGACHTGAGQQTLCLGDIEKPVLNLASYQYYFNQTGPDDLGLLVWNLPLTVGATTIQNVSLPLSLDFNPGSNVASTDISVTSRTGQKLGFHNDILYLPSTYFDDSTFVPGVYPNATGTQQLRHWHACYLMVNSYYYQALAWVTSGPPHNKNCKPVDIVKVN